MEGPSADAVGESRRKKCAILRKTNKIVQKMTCVARLTDAGSVPGGGGGGGGSNFPGSSASAATAALRTPMPKSSSLSMMASAWAAKGLGPETMAQRRRCLVSREQSDRAKCAIFRFPTECMPLFL